MSDFRIYLLRHGEIDRGHKGKFIGQIDLPLTEKGKLQALSWKDVLSDVRLGAIYCSDLVRSMETARIISDSKNLSVSPLESLREINLGMWEGLAISDVKNRFPLEWRERGENIATYRPPCGESFRDLSLRVIPAFHKIVQDTTTDALIVGHAGVNRVILCDILGMPLSNVLVICQDYGRMNTLRIENGLLSLKDMNTLPR